MAEKIKIGISTCLLEERVRCDGGHQHDCFFTGTLGGYFDFVPVCPEVECGVSGPGKTCALSETSKIHA